ncbi:MAG TPA: hypothetical protein VID30_21175 [Bradyrhizobium sp.]
MTDQNSENRELSVDELTVDELESVSGGRIKIQKPPGLIAWELAKLQQDCPGFV